MIQHKHAIFLSIWKCVSQGALGGRQVNNNTRETEPDLPGTDVSDSWCAREHKRVHKQVRTTDRQTERWREYSEIARQ